MDSKNIFVNGESLDAILIHYYALPVIIQEVKNCGGNFYKWDEERAKRNKQNIRCKN